MKTLCLALLFTLAAGAAPVAAPAATLAPTPAPTATPVPATEPEPGTGGVCPDCKMGATKTDPAKQAETEKAVLDLEIKWCEAEARHDVAFLEKVEADGFTFTDSDGKLTTKRDEIAEAKQGGEKIDFKLSDMKAHVYGDTVVLTGQTTFHPVEAGPVPNAYRWTDVFVRQGSSEWQVVASQATTVVQGEGGEDGRSE